jgi:hypothetical protein
MPVTGSFLIKVTVEPGSALPVTTTSLLSTGLIVGADGAEVSGVEDDEDEATLEDEVGVELELVVEDEELELVQSESREGVVNPEKVAPAVIVSIA